MRTSTITIPCAAIWPGRRRWNAPTPWPAVPRSAGWRRAPAGRAAVAFHEVLFDQFVASFATPPAELILDFDATDDRVHGRQEGRFFNGYYGDYCFLPLYVFCGEQLLVSYLRPSNLGAAQHSLAILKLLVKAPAPGLARGEDPLSRRQRVSAAGACCPGASATGWITSWAWPRTCAWQPWPSRSSNRPKRLLPPRKKSSASLVGWTTARAPGISQGESSSRPSTPTRAGTRATW